MAAALDRVKLTMKVQSNIRLWFSYGNYTFIHSKTRHSNFRANPRSIHSGGVGLLTVGRLFKGKFFGRSDYHHDELVPRRQQDCEL